MNVHYKTTQRFHHKAFFHINGEGNAKLIKNNQRTWCVAKPSSDDSTLLNILHYACSMTGCRPLEKDGPCFLPNSLISHASVAMNLYYQAMGRNRWNCHFNNTGLIVITDPSIYKKSNGFNRWVWMKKGFGFGPS
ncbi:hypothetical protein HPP92_014230 [Vanilla planifolia]|uniref:X8 domain-containing protein n=1 Tax=Vanilla planifolia TaxID=51239 RepID=A0A835QWB2_VANPL|nr:hypothetical protein HPP92_014230 [Vanilla planifolia]